jgi:hypothetical protein
MENFPPHITIQDILNVVVEWLTLLLQTRVQISPLSMTNLTRTFVVFFSPFRRMSGYTLKLGHDRFLPNPFQFIIHVPSPHLTQRPTVLVTE